MNGQMGRVVLMVSPNNEWTNGEGRFSGRSKLNGQMRRLVLVVSQN